jgi:hypothetical protein
VTQNAIESLVCPKKFELAQNILGPVEGQGISIKVSTYASSFYRSQNILGWSAFFGPGQKLVYILCQSQTFCVTPINDFHSGNLVFVLAQKFLKRHHIQLYFWTGPKNLDWNKTFCDL